MTFVTAGLALAGLVSTSIPILIFLLWRQRRKPVQWAAMRFLLEAYRKHRRRMRVEQLLLLAVRCLIVLLLGAALARPVLDAAGLLDEGGERVVYLVVDNGVSSGIQDADGAAALDALRTQALSIVDELAPGDRIGVITTAEPALGLIVPPTTDLAAARRAIETIAPEESASDLSSALSQLRSALALHANETSTLHAYLLSEFRLGSASLDEALPAVAASGDERFVLQASRPATAPRENISITSIDPVRQLVVAGAMDGSEQITVRLQRHGGDLGRTATQVRLGGESIATQPPRTVVWNAGQTEATAEFRIDFADQRELDVGLTASIDRDAQPADDVRYTVLSLRRQIRATVIDRRSFGTDRSIEALGSGDWISRALEPTESSAIEVVEVEPAALRPTDLRTTDVAVLIRPDLIEGDGWSLLRDFVDDGGLLMITPPGDLNIHQWTDPMRTALGLAWKLDREVTTAPAGRLLADEQPVSRVLGLISSDLSSLVQPVIVRRELGVDLDGSSGEALLTYDDGSPFVVADVPGTDDDETDSVSSSGLVVYFTAAPELAWTNLPSKPLMLPLFQELVRQGLSQIRARRPTRVGERPVLLGQRAATAIAHPDGATIAIDDARRPVRRLDRAGLYSVRDAGDRVLSTLPVNVDASATRPDPQPEAAVGLWLQRTGAWTFFDDERPGAALATAETGAPIAGLLLILVLILVVLESLLARWFSHANRSVEPGAAGSLAILPTMQDVRRPAGEGG